MVTSKEIASRLLNFSMRDFFDDDTSSFGELGDQLLDIDFEGLAINAPKAIQIDRFNKLPLILAAQQTSLRAWEVPLKKNCVMAGWNLYTTQTYFNTAFWEPQEQFRRKPAKLKKTPKPEGSDAEAIVGELFRIDAKARLELPWKPAKYLVVIISYGWVSNVVEVELQGGTLPETVEAKQVSPPMEGGPVMAPKGAPTLAKQKFPFYDVTSKTPKLSEQGIAFVIEPKTEDGAKLAVYGAFATKVKPRYIPRQSIIHQLPDGRKRTVAAVVPMTFFILGLNWEVPMRWDWTIPVYSDQIPKEGTPLRGYFAIDAMAREENPLPAGSYVGYIIMEENVFGPVKFEL